MTIGDLFRSKTKHSDPAVRAEAVRELGPDNLELLSEIVREDADAEIRSLALDKIEDCDALIELSRTAAAPTDQRAADRAGELLARKALDGPEGDDVTSTIARIAEIGSFKALTSIALKAPTTVTKRAAIDAIGDERVLADIVRHSSDEAICREALGKIGNPEALAAIAVSETRKGIAVAALERISDQATLTRIEAKAGQKAVRSRARQLLGHAETEVPATEIEPERLAHAERVQLTATMESMSRDQDFRRAEEFSAALARFEILGVGNDSSLATRFEGAAQRYREGLERYQAQRAKMPPEPEPEPEPDVVTEPDPAVVTEPESEPAVVTEPVADQPSDGTPVVVRQPDSQSVTRPVSMPAPGEDVDPAEAVAAAEAEVSADDAKTQKVNKAKEKDKGPSLPTTPEETAKYLEALCQNLESLATSDKLKTINRGLARAEKRFNALGSPPTKLPELLARLERARQALLIRAGEIREAMEWQMWANIAKQEQLIERAAKLAADPGANKLGDRLRTLQTEWKELGPAPRDKAQDLWEKFKAACDSIYERVKSERKEDNEERRANLAAKISLCEQAEAVAESEDWAETAQLLKTLQNEWKKVGPAPRRQSDKLWKRFRGACDRFFERRKPHLEERLAEFRDAIEEKTAIIEEIEALVTEEARATDWQKRADKFDDLARRFGRAGRVPPREFALFRKRQDAVEKALKKERAERRAAEEARRAEAASSVSAAIDDARGQREAGTLSGADLAKTVIELRVSARDLGGSDAARAVQDKIDAEIVLAVESEPGAFAGTELDPEVSRQRKEKLCAKVEKLLPDKKEEAATAEDMAAKLRAMLADRALGGVLSKQADPRTIKKVVSEALESWARLGPVPGSTGAALEERFKGACERARRSGG